MSVEGLTGQLGLASPQFLRWPGNVTVMQRDLLYPIHTIPVVVDETYEFRSEPFDVAGLPDISIQVSDEYGLEGEFTVSPKIDVSLDGQNWTRIPDNDFQPDLSTVEINISDTGVFITLFVQTHFIRLVLVTGQSPPFPETAAYSALITAGEA